jgi:NADH-quinone oxidoreductase subunit L
LIDGFLGPPSIGKEAKALAEPLEAALMGIAGMVAFSGLLIAYLRYGGARREARLATAALPPSRMTAFLLHGWYLDELYSFIFVRPYEKLARFLWKWCDEWAIDDSLDRLAAFLGSSGEWLGRWATGRVSLYLLSFATGLAALLGYLALVMYGT